MKSVNVMNFVRQCEPRIDDFDDRLLEMTEKELALVNEMGVENTFLLQYDALCDARYTELFLSKATDKTEVGLWFEIVEPLTSACSLPYRSEKGWKWDWHITPGFSMSYRPHERERLVDEAMRKFHEVFGYYPRTVGSWLLDTHTVNYLTQRYAPDALCICRDQTNTDAYTLVGGYFSGGYYPSKNNCFTPAQTDEYQVNVPIFRLLGACPLFNYDGEKYQSAELREAGGCCTLEPAWYSGQTPTVADAYFRSYFGNECLSQAYVQIGQENSFADRDIITALRMQIEKLQQYPDVEFLKMSESGKRFRQRFSRTPAASVVALDNWDKEDLQSVYYSSCHYVANLFRCGKELFIRALYLFDERVPDRYMTSVCSTFAAEYENLPIVDTNRYAGTKTSGIGITLDMDAIPFSVQKTAQDELTVAWGDKTVIFTPDSIILHHVGKMRYHPFDAGEDAGIQPADGEICFCYRSHTFRLKITADSMTVDKDDIVVCGDTIQLIPAKK